MRLKSIFILVALFMFTISVFGQRLNESSAPEKVKNLLEVLRKEIEAKGLTFDVGYNPALKYSIDQLCRTRETANWREIAKSKNVRSLRPRSLRALSAEVALPQKWDWREHSGVTGVRDQLDCGSCWAFGAVATFESFLLIRQGIAVDLSEQFLVSCNPWDWGCDGGWWPHDLLVDPGAVLEADFRYVARDVACGGPYNYPYALNGWAYVDGEDNIPSPEMLKEAIYNYGPVCAAIYVGDAFQSYSGGLFNKDESPKKGLLDCSEPPKVNHAIVLVGWDDVKGAWILRNSWSEGWGDNGYMYIKYGISNVGLGAIVVY